MRRILAAMVVALTGLASAAPGLPGYMTTAAFANEACGTNGTVSRDGWQADAEGGYGAQAWINVRTAPLCTGGSYGGGLFSEELSSAWALLGPDPNKNVLAQAGYVWEKGATWALYFVEWADPNCTYQPFFDSNNGYWYCGRTWGSVANAHNDLYQVYPGRDMQIEMDIDGSEVALTSYVAQCSNSNPNEQWCGPWGEEWSGEAHDPGSNMPGLVGTKASFTSVAYMPQNNGVWGNPATHAPEKPDQSDSGMSYCEGTETSNSFNIWTGTSSTCP